MEPLKLELATLDGVAESVAALYEKDGDVYRLNVDAPDDALGRALRSERGARREAERTISTTTAETQAAVAARDAAVAEAKQARGLLLAAKVAAASAAVGLHSFAVADATRAARELFDIGSNGDVIAKDGKGTLAEWLASTRVTSPHWWPGVGGSGAQQSYSDRAPAPRVMTRTDFDRQRPAQKAALLSSGVELKD